MVFISIYVLLTIKIRQEMTLHMSEVDEIVQHLHDRLAALEAQYAIKDSEGLGIGFGTGFTNHGHTSVPPRDAASNLIFHCCEAVQDYFYGRYHISNWTDFITERKLNGKMRKCFCTYIKCKKVATARYIPTILVPNMNSQKIACIVYIFNYEQGEPKDYDIEILFAKDKNFNKVEAVDIFPNEENNYKKLKTVIIKHLKEKLGAAMDVVTS